MFICSPAASAAAAVGVDVVVSAAVDVVVATTETNQPTVPASGLATHRYTHSHTKVRKAQTLWVAAAKGKEGNTPDHAARNNPFPPTQPQSLLRFTESTDFRQ